MLPTITATSFLYGTLQDSQSVATCPTLGHRMRESVTRLPGLRTSGARRPTSAGLLQCPFEYRGRGTRDRVQESTGVSWILREARLPKWRQSSKWRENWVTR